MDVLMLALGVAVLVAGGEALVRGASSLALAARVAPAVVGLTVVAAGTSMPELVVSVQAALEGRAGLSLGNVVGSNLFNIGAIVGLAAWIQPLKVSPQTVRAEWPVMMLAALVLAGMCADRWVSRFDGTLLTAALLAFLGMTVWFARRPGEAGELDAEVPQGWTGWMRAVGYVVTGAAALAGGAWLLVRGAVGIATGLGVTETVIGRTIVAAGTSAPELVTSLVAARRGQDDIALANVVGSNIFNVLAILGVTALIQPLHVPAVLLDRDLWWMLGASLLLLPVMWTGMRVSRVEGAGLFMGFLGYLVWLVGAVST